MNHPGKMESHSGADLYTYPLSCVFLGAQLLFIIQIPVLVNLGMFSFESFGKVKFSRSKPCHFVEGGHLQCW